MSLTPKVLRKLFFSGSIFVNGFFLTHIILEHSLELFPSQGESMLPTLNVNRDYLLISTKYRHGKDVAMGDMVTAFKPSEPLQRVCKRITGMPGDIILIDPSNASVLTNMKEYLADDVVTQKYKDKIKLGDLDDNDIDTVLEDFVRTRDQNSTFNKTAKTSYGQYIRIPEGHCWLTGDNLSNSFDSRSYSVVPLGLIAGKVVGKLYIEHALAPWTWRYKAMENSFHDFTS